MSAPVDAPELADLAVTLERVAGWVRRTSPPAEWNLVALSTLDRLDRTGPQRVSDLVARESISQPGMTGLVARLESAGLVARAPDPTDGRATLVSLTTAGQAYLRERHRLRAETVVMRLRSLPAADRRALLAALPALGRLADQPGTEDLR
ncbi:MarR family winged helix-turn-helix transcriptional regulator [Pseudonocardia sp. N23]|uniref:MarR family winged helix-turn-helix transcriptional regulator n=1 Tax=Pseudonocardia sp. N23 TaxID=1987376 RepID=UPI000BFBA7E7|nr:MarR family transcriptional regulator [Pseudonocardia sp. N23]GAY07779.1 transcriptional regulator, MarR family [Pseudonocardia sp. N23]